MRRRSRWQVEWAAAPRSPKEFFAKFTPPKTASKWASRMKCNAYFYRTNYVLIVLLTLTVAFYPEMDLQTFDAARHAGVGDFVVLTDETCN